MDRGNNLHSQHCHLKGETVDPRTPVRLAFVQHICLDEGIKTNRSIYRSMCSKTSENYFKEIN
jgi:hypothetical protein